MDPRKVQYSIGISGTRVRERNFDERQVSTRRNHACPPVWHTPLLALCPVAALAHPPLRSGLMTRPRVRHRLPAVLGEEKAFGCGRSLLLGLF